MAAKNNQKKYDWSGCSERLQALGYRSFNAWCRQYGFNRKTGQALRKGNITWGIGPKVSAILAQAIVDGLVVIVD
jgi:hypothetical protein